MKFASLGRVGVWTVTVLCEFAITGVWAPHPGAKLQRNLAREIRGANLGLEMLPTNWGDFLFLSAVWFDLSLWVLINYKTPLSNQTIMIIPNII